MSKSPPSKDNIDIGKRIKLVRETVLGMTQKEFAAKLDVSRGAVNNWERGEPCGREAVRGIAKLAGTTLEWVEMGRGNGPDIMFDMSRNGDQSDPEPHDVSDAFILGNYHPKIRSALPELDVWAGAGEGRDGEIIALQMGEENYSAHKVTAEWLLPESFLYGQARATKSQTLVLPVIGDSMFPTYNYGDRILVDLSQKSFVPDTVFVISDGISPPRIKRLVLVHGTKPPKVRIISDNQLVPSEEHFLTDVVIIGRVCGVIARR